MQLSFAAPAVETSGVWVVGALAGGGLTHAAQRADKAAGGVLTRALKTSRFKGKPNEILEVIAPDGLKATRLLLVGLGKAEEFSATRAEVLAAMVTGRLLSSGETQAMFEIDVPKGSKLKAPQLAAHLAFGAQLKSYQFIGYRRKNLEDYEQTLKTVTVATLDAAAARKNWQALSAVADGVFLARNLVNEPPNVLSPPEFARRAKALTKLGVKVTVLDEAQMKKLGMNALLGVGQGSEQDSQVVVMEWNGSRKAKAPIALVGKGVCFDSGGLSLKTGAGMMGMKGDMGGAAAVTGAIHALAARKAKAHVVGIIGLVENMPDGKAQRPDDVVESMSGQTIEILNTDAEGRLVLADVLWYVQEKYKPSAIIDLATLTGAIIAALGAEYAGLFSNNDKLSEQLSAAGKAEGEPVWRFPMGNGYDKLIKSKIADMKNIGGPFAGSITAAQFLQRFVKDKTPWAHLDIAGVAWQDGEQKPLIPSWATGWGVRILNRLIADNYES
ncbi:MAG TPA: leucyl aminopeptidase [Rhizomicrobium sp.]|nr:leucyl aminopeptidase [Rhizomicrobium sp.]